MSLDPNKRWIPFIVVFAALAVVGCEVAGPPPVARPVAGLKLTATSFHRLSGWDSDDHAVAMAAFMRSCGAFWKMPTNSPVGKIGGYAADWQSVCDAARNLGKASDGVAKIFFESHFKPYIATAGNDVRGLFTGYYEAELKGSWLAHGRYRTPIYRLPYDPVLAAKFSRAEIENGALSGMGLELLWVDDPVDAFFLHIQGSGRVMMEDGRVVRLGFAGRNGRAYVSIGRELVRRGLMTVGEISMRRIRGWLKAHPRQGSELMSADKSFIFFKITGIDAASNAANGPIGAQGVALTPGRSLAVDRRFIPLGVPIWLDITDPVDSNGVLRRLVVAQDSGSAIKGPVRGDLFWGFGKKAADYAGRMKSTGRYYILLPKKL